MTQLTDVLIIGSGFGAAAPALRLAQAGLDVLMIEKGKGIVPEKDFKMTQDPAYLTQYLKGISSDTLGLTYAEALGGGSGFYEMVSLRAPSAAFDQVDGRGRKLWPGAINRQLLDPWYDVADRMLNVEQIAQGDVPRAGLVFSQMMANLGYSCDRARYAVKGCIGSGYCVTGCVFGAKQSLHMNYLPQARAAGLVVMTDLEALSIEPAAKDLSGTRGQRNVHQLPYRYEVLVRNTIDGTTSRIRARIVVLGGGTVGSAALLMRSRDSLTKLGKHVGRNIAINGSVKAAGLLPEGIMEGDMLSGRTHPGMISYHFLETMGITVSSVKPMPLNIVAAAHLYQRGVGRSTKYWGEDNVELMKQYRRRMVILYALGMTPPTASLETDASGRCTPHMELDAGLRRYHEETKVLLDSILQRNGCEKVDARPITSDGREHEDLFWSTTHMTGSCRMADSKRDGVVDAHGEVFDYPGLFVTDGAAIPTSLAVNSSLTILANAERIASHMARWFRAGTGRTVVKQQPLNAA